MIKWIILLISHGLFLAIGFAAGIYFLPILTAPSSPDQAMLEASAQNADYTGEFTRNLEGSDFVHWGEGTISIANGKVVHEGKLAPGPDYKLYLVPEFAETEAAFEAIKNQSLRVGDVKSFGGFILDIPAETDLTKYTTALIWCEAFGEFITAARFR